MRQLLIAGNWKMNCGPAETEKLLLELKKETKNGFKPVEVLVCPPEISLTTAAEVLGATDIKFGAQNVHFKNNGAFTGEVSTKMLNEIGCSYVIVGHSERREYFGETDTTVNKKTKKALQDDIKPIICIGESLSQRKKGVHHQMVKKQVHAALNQVDESVIENVILAYEPLWAIGTGETATPDQAQEIHAMIRNKLKELYNEDVAERIRVLYGGSMKPHNAEELISQPDVDGGLIGGASLKADSFSAIIDVAVKLANK